MDALNLSRFPFSRKGSFSYVTWAELRDAGSPLRIMTCHRTQARQLLDVRLGGPGDSRGYEAKPTMSRLTLNEPGGGEVTLCFETPTRLRFSGRGMTGSLRLVACPGMPIARFDLGGGAWELRCGSFRQGFRPKLCLSIVRGAGGLTTEGEEDRLHIDVAPDAGGAVEVTLEESNYGCVPVREVPAIEQVVAKVEAELERLFAAAGGGPAGDNARRAAWRLAHYTLWASEVRPFGMYRRPSVLMSKFWMHRVWSWDHAFNAMALATTDPDLAWDQFCIPFDYQGPTGALPDLIDDQNIDCYHCKPPIHGWALRRMLQTGATVPDERLAEAYDRLSRLTRFWLDVRDSDGNGLPEYHSGCDSGWDNNTTWFIGDAGSPEEETGGTAAAKRAPIDRPLEGPDLAAFLVLQTGCLAELADRLDRTSETEAWWQARRDLLDRLLADLWDGRRFVARTAVTHQASTTSQTLMPFLPLVLGEALPEDVFETLVADMLEPGRFLTEWGLATESPRSPHYIADGYWRGPVWAPSTMLIVDGLLRGGAQREALDIAERFCRLCEKSGFAENFNAVTGEPLRCPAYTWTASVYLLLVDLLARYRDNA